MVEMLQTVGYIGIPTTIFLYLLELILLLQCSKYAYKNYRVGKMYFILANITTFIAKIMFWLTLIGISITITKAII